jgi:mono/diheme cytochrome c family protein
MVFNEGVNGGPHFGPAHWQGDALVCGESRGKIWRTKLAKTPLGYVAQNHLIACLSLLTVDACVSPQGDLLVACHSGPPDWGTGPAGEGRVLKIHYANRNAPQPVLAWAAASDEFRIAFDRPLEPAEWAKAKADVKIEGGPFVSAGDRFEVVRPGYQVVRDQLATPRRWIDVLGLTLSQDHRTLGLRVPRQTEPVNYAITLPQLEPWKTSGGISQHPQMDLQVTLNGLAASVKTSDGKEQSTVLPHPSLAASATLATSSAEHEAFLNAAAAKGAKLTLRGIVNVSNPFVPATQPGAKLDWDIAADPFASATFSVRSDYGTETGPLGEPSSAGFIRLVQSVSGASTNGLFLEPNGLFLAHDNLRHSLATNRIYVPWAEEKSAAADAKAVTKVRTDVKGNWLSGRRLFFGQATCFTCHTLRGEGMTFGPDLSNLVFRDRDSVLHDILQPSATINPDQAGSLVKLTDGTSDQGIIHSLTTNNSSSVCPRERR